MTENTNTQNKEDGFWVRFWMESGRGHSSIDETYVYYRYSEGYTKEDSFEDDAYNWAGYDMDGFNMMRFKSGFEFVIVPPSYWLQEELIRINKEREDLTSQENLIKKALGMK